jgi:hypothetical protein
VENLGVEAVGMIRKEPPYRKAVCALSVPVFGLNSPTLPIPSNTITPME